MTFFMELLFAVCIFLVIYTYIFYPLTLVFISKFVKREYKRDENFVPKVSILVAAYNEEKIIAERIENLLSLHYPADALEILVGSDGSNDRTVEIAKTFLNYQNLRLFDLGREGKVSVLNTLLKESTGDILVFTDANTMFKADALRHLVRHFVDERIGCVSGQLRLRVKRNCTGSQGESVYWKYENLVKQMESSVGKLSGANGAIYAIRKELCPLIKEGIINDDFFVSTSVISNGYDVIMDQDAIAYEEPNDTLSSQFQRHIRDGAGHYQALAHFSKLLSPFGGLNSFTYVSHRVIRWIAPFCIILVFILNALLISYNVTYLHLFNVQVGGYAVMVIYYFLQKYGVVKNRVINIPFYFLCVNLALILGFFKFMLGRQKRTWETQR